MDVLSLADIGTIIDFPKLNGSNFHEWKLSMRLFLKARGEWEAGNPELGKFKCFGVPRDTELADTLIGLGVDLPHLKRIQDLSKGKEIWMLLEGLYNKGGHKRKDVCSGNCWS